jgi:thiamine biosynthesis protein ThiS
LQIQLNGENHELADASTLEDLVRGLSLTPQRVAIELNRAVVRRDQWAQTNLDEGDRVEIVHFVGGGVSDVRL